MTFNWPYLRSDNYRAGDIRRFVSIGTPYDGSEMANYWRALAEFFVDNPRFYRTYARRVQFIAGKFNVNGTETVFPTACPDLQPNSVAQRWMDGDLDGLVGQFTGTQYPTSRAAVKWYPIATVAVASGSPHSPAHRAIMNLIAPSGLPIPEFGVDYDDWVGTTDLIVRVESQRNRGNGANAGRGQLFNDLVHSTSVTAGSGRASQVDTEEIAERVWELLCGWPTELYVDGLDH